MKDKIENKNKTNEEKVRYVFFSQFDPFIIIIILRELGFFDALHNLLSEIIFLVHG